MQNNIEQTGSAGAVTSSGQIIPSPVDTRQRVISATITVRVGTISPEDMPRVAERRKRDLEAWLERHWKDITDEGSSFDDFNLEVEMTIEK